MTTNKLYINGEFVQARTSATLDVIDPATTEVIARVPDASAADVDVAAKAARTAFDKGPWKDTTAQDRGRILFKLAEIVRRLIEAYRPLRLYLFGSHARGEAGADSDYDLLLVVPDDASPERRRSRLAYRVLRGTGTAAG